MVPNYISPKGLFSGQGPQLPDDDGCYADKTGYDSSTLIGTSVSLSILQQLMNSFCTIDISNTPIVIIGFMLFWKIQILQML